MLATAFRLTGNKEKLIWMGVALLALVSRVLHLDARGMSHDESLHALYSFYLFDRGEYAHDPMMHGPLLFHLNAAIYWLGGATDFTARLAPALAGALAVGSLWWYRRYLGTVGALAAALLLLVSPSLLFHSRYIRNDIYVVLFGLAWIYSLFRYVESGAGRWMTGMGMAMMLGFASKENHFITGAIAGLFSAGMAVCFTGQDNERGRMLAARYGDAALTMALLIGPFLTPLLAWIWGGSPIPTVPSEQLRAGIAAGSLSASALVLGWLWFRRLKPAAWRGAFGFRQFAGLWAGFWIGLLLLFTTFGTNPQGVFSGVVGSLGYWLAQQEVQRGSQPWFYYLFLSGFYEYLPLWLTGIGGLALGRAAQRWARAVRQAGASFRAAPMPILLQVPLFLAWWVVGSWVGYSYAGERMPWLLSHIATPMCLLGGYGLAHLWRAAAPRGRRAGLAVALLGGGLTCLVCMLALVPFAGRELAPVRATVLWSALLIGGCIGLWWGGRRLLRLGAQRRPLLALALTAPLGLLTVRGSYQLSFVNYDYVVEYLMYAHASPDVKTLMREIDAIGDALQTGRELAIAYDHDNSWPLAWYFRDYAQARIYHSQDPDPELLASPVVLAGPSSWNAVRPLMESDYVKRQYRLIWWPEESYKQWSLRAGPPIGNADARRRFSRLFFFREHPRLDLQQWPHRREFEVYVRRDLAPLIWTQADFQAAHAPRAPDTPIAPLVFPLAAVLDADFAGTPLLHPRSVFVSEEGYRVITDSGNHRVLILDRNNELVRSVGSHCALEPEASPACADLDGPGPMVLGDGQFNEPWGAALTPNGALFVADTWNHRIQAFDRTGRFAAKWGTYGQAADASGTEALRLYGPRGLALDRLGRPIAADTGNHRLLRFTAQGEWLAAAGGRGQALGQFHEPVSVIRAGTNDRLYVTDAWNGRIQMLSPTLEPLSEIVLPASLWKSRGSLHKPFVAYIPDYGLAVTDPENGRVVFVTLEGNPIGALGYAGGTEADLTRAFLPIGIAYDPVTLELLVVDASAHGLRIYDLSRASAVAVG